MPGAGVGERVLVKTVVEPDPPLLSATSDSTIIQIGLEAFEVTLGRLPKLGRGLELGLQVAAIDLVEAPHLAIADLHRRRRDREAWGGALEAARAVLNSAHRQVEGDTEMAYALTGTLSELQRTIRTLRVFIEYIEQKQRLGLGHAVWTARENVGDEPFFVHLAEVLANVTDAAVCLRRLAPKASIIAALFCQTVRPT